MVLRWVASTRCWPMDRRSLTKDRTTAKSAAAIACCDPVSACREARIADGADCTGRTTGLKNTMPISHLEGVS